MKKFDFIIIIIVLAIALGSLGIYFLIGGSNDATSEKLMVYIYEDGKLSRTLPLDDDDEVLLESKWGHNKVLIEDGTVSVTEADCSGNECVHSGKKSFVGDMIACLPHRLLIRIEPIGYEKNIAQEKYSLDFVAMDAPMTITAFGDDAKEAVEEAKVLVEEIDVVSDIHTEDSEASALNRDGMIKGANPEILKMFERGLELSNKSSGAFDLTIRPISAMWNIGHDDARVPKQTEIDAALEKVDYGNVQISGDDVTLANGANIDLGGIAKGYAADRIAEMFREKGIKNALIVLSGNIYALGHGADGDVWQIGLQDPDLELPYIGVIFASDISVVTSGGYERFSIIDGKKYSHIFDSSTGFPVDNDLKSVTIISEDSTLADAYSTALYAMGLDKALEFQAAHSDEFDAILVTTDNEIVCTPNLSVGFELTDETGKYRLR